MKPRGKPEKQQSEQTQQVSKSKGGQERVEIVETPALSHCFSFNFAETECLWKSWIHSKSQAGGEEAPYQRITHGESTITFLI